MNNDFVSKYSTPYYTVPSPTHELLWSKKVPRHRHMYGAVRTGKSRACITWFIQNAFILNKLDPNTLRNYCIIARSRASLLYNILQPISGGWLPVEIAKQFPISQNSSGCRMGQNRNISIRYFTIEDRRALSRLLGSSLQGIYIDEVTCLDAYDYSIISSRLTGIAGDTLQTPFILTSSNPHGITHWLNQTYILPAKRGEWDDDEVQAIQFKLDYETCPFLNKSNIDSLYRDFERIPSLYKRNILGEFASNEGAVFSMLCDDHLISNAHKWCDRWVVGLDFGYSSENAFVVVGATRDTFFGHETVVLYRSAQFSIYDVGNSSASYRAHVLAKMIEGLNVEAIIYDAAQPDQAISMSSMLSQEYNLHIPFIPSEKNRQESLEWLLIGIAKKHIVFDKECAMQMFNSLLELEFDDKKELTHIVKAGRDHIFDAIRYALGWPPIKQKLLWKNYYDN